MLELSAPILNSHIWRGAFETNDAYKHDRDRLKQSFMQFRERASQLASEIRVDLPDLTIHDITHLDALWETAAQITGPEYSLTPTETYVLGGAILLHDLAMSIAATPGGLGELKKTQRWKDLVHSKYRTLENRLPEPEEIESPSPAIHKSVIFDLLRRIHAESAEKLAFTSFIHKGNQLFLIEDAELRLAYGRVIGEIAHSHWWSVTELEKRFKNSIGTPPWASATNWHVNPLKIACILRAADAAHLDARRAPIFVRSFSRLNPISAQHWDFQEKLLKPYLKEDALIFTSGQSFPFKEASSWWVCIDTLKMVDAELRSIDALLSDNNESRFAARRVAGIDHPERISKLIQTEGWSPVNATIQISDMPSIIRSIGGEELYGTIPTVPVRELIQNSADAIRARRMYERLPETYGEIEVSLSSQDGAHWLQIKDNGTGMSETVLTSYLLDFGKSFWTSNYVHEEFPGLASSDFQATGKYGIGFFSAFMIADNIKVTTRHVDAAKKETLVLEFGCGLLERPTIRPARPEEYIREGGTSITIKLLKNPYEEGGILYHNYQSTELRRVCSVIAPALDVKIISKENQLESVVSEANDWKNISNEALISRLVNNSMTKGHPHHVGIPHEMLGKNLRFIYDENSKIAGRACITLPTNEHGYIHGSLTVGGLECNSLRCITGILLGRTLRASRDLAEPLVPRQQLAKWASEQARLVRDIYTEPDQLSQCALIISICGGDTLDLPVAKLNENWLSINDIRSLPSREKLFVTEKYYLSSCLKNLKKPVITEDVLTFDLSGYYSLIARRGLVRRGEDYFSANNNALLDKILGAIADSWKTDRKNLPAFFDYEKMEEIQIGHNEGEEDEIICSGFYLVKPLTT